MSGEQLQPPTPEEREAQALILTICESGEVFETLDLQIIQELLVQTGLPVLPPDHTRRHSTKEWYFQTQDGAICHLTYTPQLGYELDIISSSAVVTEGELSNIKLIKRMSKILTLKITDVLQQTIDRLTE
ncbi:hypothetical protein ACFL3T_03370 [Patescibacteria group bacterium]